MKRFATPVITAALLMASVAASAQSASAADSARARYEQERQACMTNNTQDTLATCLRDATNAYDAARRGQLSDPGPIAMANATQRCDAFQNAQDRAECVRRIENDPASGSVSGGGVLRESVTTTVVPQ
ncbi:hypothetical protein [Paracidovorax sp. MALMAid1276]|uniref:hypothetical protein n=1 Tax=Paracidovorax sp. MALMAid1276 TaxID=3411631 RepID=UPI003B9A7195